MPLIGGLFRKVKTHIMSHFTVLVIGNDIEKALAPYQENNMDDCPKEYLRYCVHDKDYNSHWFASKEEAYKSGIDIEEEGYWENPNAKWDWWVLGGRWTGFFKMKEGAAGEAGEPGLMTPRAAVGKADRACKKDIDFDGMRAEKMQAAMERYDRAMEVIGHLPPNEPWETFREKFESIDQARVAYWEQQRCAAWREAETRMGKDWPFSWRGSPDDFLISKEEYVEKARLSAITTHALLHEGKWYERGEMGWFAVVTDEKHDWDTEFNKLLDELPDDAILNLVDCHI